MRATTICSLRLITVSGICTESMTPTSPIQHPRPGMLATVRNGRGLIAAVEPFDSPDGRLHLVRVEYTDSDGVAEDTVPWEREHVRDLLEPNALPQVETEASMEPREFDALVGSARWAALMPFLHPDGSGRSPESLVSAPFFGAVQVDDFQLVPLLKALVWCRRISTGCPGDAGTAVGSIAERVQRVAGGKVGIRTEAAAVDLKAAPDEFAVAAIFFDSSVWADVGSSSENRPAAF